MRSRRAGPYYSLNPMPGPWQNHGNDDDDARREAMKKLADAWRLLRDGQARSSDGVKRESQFADIWPGVQGLEMAMVVISFPEESRLARHKLAFTVDWVLSETTGDIARAIAEQIRKRT